MTYEFSPVKVGFTGTQKGMTAIQNQRVYEILFTRRKAITEFHHGDCVGADAEAFMLAAGLGLKTVSHPPTNPEKRANTVGNDEERAPKDYIQRNHDIVDETDLLVAAPRGPQTLRSGTWATIRYAKEKGKRLIVVDRSGKIL